MIYQILLIVLPVFFVIWLGFGLKCLGLIHERFVEDMNRLIYYAALPGLLFYKIATADFGVSFNPTALFGLSLSLFLGFVFAYWFGAFRCYSPAVHGAFTQASSRGNLAYVGLAIIFSAYGETGMTKAGVLLGFIVPAMSLLSIMALILPYRHELHGGRRSCWLKQLFYNPMLIGPVAGICWSYLQLPMPALLNRGLSIFTAMSLPLALLSIGGAFSFTKFRGSWETALWATSIKIVFLPVLAGFVLYWLGIRGEELGIGVLLAGTPTATVSYIMAHQLRGDAELSANVIMLSTLLTIGTYTVALYLLHLIAN